MNRNSDNILRDLKKTLRRPEEKLTAEEVDQLGVLWNPDLNYSFMYRFVLDVCKYLDVTVPAIFFCSRMMDQFSELRGVVFPGNAPYVTDAFIKAEISDMSWCLKRCLHELRHVWQHQFHDDWFLKYYGYTETQKENYSFQQAEIDADAFAYWVMEANGFKWHLEDLGEERESALKKRMQEFSDIQAPVFKYLSPNT